MEPPSERLRQTLLELRLCRPADIRRCRRRVRRLARDLPAFDSVWIDALLQARRLTPFQARLLESPHPEDLAVGPCVLLDRLGQGRWAATYLARLREERRRCVLKLIELPLEALPAALRNLQRLTEQLEAAPHPHVVGPHTALRHGDRLVAVSRHVDGLRASELLVRRGRFAPEIVVALARQLVDGLSALEREGVVHGDLRLSNVRLTSAGQAVLVDAGLAPATRPQLLIHAGLPPECYDGVAPELIGTGSEPTVASDVYALGCALWQLLAGRPPFPTGDPLAKLAAHQTREIGDVREWAPDTPEPLARLIARFTDRDPAQRPPSFAECLRELRRPGRGGQRRLARFRAEFSSSVPPRRGASASRRWLLNAALLAAAGVGLCGLDDGIRGDVLALLPDRLQRLFDEGRSNRETDGSGGSPVRSRAEPGNEAGDGLRPLPLPDASGLIELDSPGPYVLGAVEAGEKLIIRGVGNARPLLLAAEGARLATGEIVLENVTVRAAPRPAGAAAHQHADDESAAGPTSPLVSVSAHSLRLVGCWFESGDIDDGPAADLVTGEALALLAWQPIGSPETAAGRVVIEETVFVSPGAAVHCGSAPARIDISNSLKLGTGPLLALGGTPRSSGLLRVRLDRVTLRGSEALLAWSLDGQTTAGGPLDVEATECVFDLVGPRAALVHLVADRVSTRLLAGIQITGQGSVTTTGAAEVALVSPSGTAFRRLDHGAIHVEGLSAAPFEFLGPATRRAADSAVRGESIHGPRLSSRPPGIDPARLFLPD